MIKIMSIQQRLKFGLPVILMGETGCGKTALAPGTAWDPQLDHPNGDPSGWQAARLMVSWLYLTRTTMGIECLIMFDYLLLLLLLSLVFDCDFLLLLPYCYCFFSLIIISWHWPATSRGVGGPSGPNDETTILMAERRWHLGTILVASPNFSHHCFHFFQHECAKFLILLDIQA